MRRKRGRQERRKRKRGKEAKSQKRKRERKKRERRKRRMERRRQSSSPKDENLRNTATGDALSRGRLAQPHRGCSSKALSPLHDVSMTSVGPQMPPLLTM